jgi:hypothetical protein
VTTVCPQAVTSVGILAAEVREHGPSAVQKYCPGVPALVLRPPQEAPATQDFSATLRWSRKDLDLSETHSGEGPSPWSVLAQPDGLVVPLLKSDRNPFAGVLAVGRGVTVDIQLLAGGVSKNHALLRQGADGWFIQDSGSRNGTFVNGRCLDPNVSTPIPSGTELRFSDVVGMFLEAEGLLTICSLAPPA